jgi:hypothetical protein
MQELLESSHAALFVATDQLLDLVERVMARHLYKSQVLFPFTMGHNAKWTSESLRSYVLNDLGSKGW